MEITNRSVNNTPLTPQPPVEAGTSTSGTQPGSSSTTNSSTYTPSPELVRLLDQVQAQPDVRGDRVQAALERVQQGYYHNQASIEQTAQAGMFVAEALCKSATNSKPSDNAALKQWGAKPPAIRN